MTSQFSHIMVFPDNVAATCHKITVSISTDCNTLLTIIVFQSIPTTTSLTTPKTHTLNPLQRPWARPLAVMNDKARAIKQVLLSEQHFHIF